MFWKKYCGDKFWYNTLYGLESLTPKYDLFWRDVIVNYTKIREIPSTAKKKIERKMATKIRED
jgi:DNA-binding LytR/AlgR family response regulator